MQNETTQKKPYRDNDERIQPVIPDFSRNNPVFGHIQELLQAIRDSALKGQYEGPAPFLPEAGKKAS